MAAAAKEKNPKTIYHHKLSIKSTTNDDLI